jgi:MFS superfamily sulfate permease-like transporter
LILIGVIRFGYVTDLLSLPIRYGYLNGIAIAVIVSQLPKVFGFSVDADGLLPQSVALAQGIARGDAVLPALLIGLGAVVMVTGVRRSAPGVPGVLVAVVVSTAAVALFGLADEVAVVGSLPRGLPSFEMPLVDASDLLALSVAAIGIALVAFADTSVLSRTFASRLGQDVDPNQEVIALGLANAVTGFFRGFPISSSASRTPVAESAGARTQLTGLVGAGVIALLLVAAPSLFADLPQAALGGIVIVAATSLIEVRGVVRLARVRSPEFWLSIVCFLGVALLGVIPGIFLSIVLALGQFIQRAWWPHDAVLGRSPGLKGYHDVTRHPEGREIPGLLLYRWDAPLFFANAARFRDRARYFVRRADPRARWIVVAGEPITDIDATAATMLKELLDELEANDIEFAFAGLRGPVWDQLGEYGLAQRIGEDHRFPTIGTAVKAYVRRTNTPWVDPVPD